MKIYSHDYTLPSEAEKKVHKAYLAVNDPEIKQLLADAQELLRQYLSQDNMVEDPDCEGWVRTTDVAVSAEVEERWQQALALVGKPLTVAWKPSVGYHLTLDGELYYESMGKPELNTDLSSALLYLSSWLENNAE